MKKIFIIFLLIFGIIGCTQNNEKIENIETKTSNQEIKKEENKTKNEEKICIKEPKIEVFMYHYIRDDDPNDNKMIRDLSVTPENFESHMQIVQNLKEKWKIELLNWEELEKWFENNCFPTERIWIFTADDGWVDNAIYLAPIAKKYNIPFIFGIISGKIGQKWFISKEQLLEIANEKIFTIASHTITHPALNSISLTQAKNEICNSKKQLEEIIGKNVNLFIYPLGKIWNNSVKILEKCWYSLAWSTSFGKNLDWKNPEKFIMNRIRIHHDTGAKFFENLANK